MSSYFQTLSYFFTLPWHIQWRTALVQIPRYVPLSILHLTSREGPQPFVIALPSRKNSAIPTYVFVPPKPVYLNDDDESSGAPGEWHVPVVLDFHGGGFIMGSPLEQAPYAAMMSRELGAVVISVSYRIGPFHQFPAAIHDAEDVLSAILDTDGVSKAGKILRTEINRYYTLMREAARNQKTKKQNRSSKNSAHLHDKKRIILDSTRLAISGFSAGGNIALNMAISVPPCMNVLSAPTTTTRPTLSTKSSSFSTGLFSPLLPAKRELTKLDDPNHPWETLLPPPQAQPRMIPLLLFYPSLDARLLPHERPMKHMPSALKGDDKSTQKAKVPGLFSIMGPTYLPKKLRAHPRASPGLVDAENVQKNASIFLVLPEKDSLAVQSDVWVDKMNSSGWNGKVRFGDGRRSDWDGHEGGTSLLAAAEDNENNDNITNGGLEVWHAPECRHGWTQFPEAILGKHEKRERKLVFNRTLEFVQESWGKQLPVQRLGNTS